MKPGWKFISSGIDGERFEISGINVWEHEWISEKKYIEIKDPIYGESHTMTIYHFNADGKLIRFAAGEFSNMVWGFYEEVSIIHQ